VWAAGAFQRTRDQLVRTSSLLEEAQQDRPPSQQLLSASASRLDCQPTQCFARSQTTGLFQPTTTFPGSILESVDLCLLLKPRYSRDHHFQHSSHSDTLRTQPDQDVTPTTNAWAFGLLCTIVPPPKTTAMSSRSGFSVKSQKMFQMEVVRGRQSSEIAANYAKRRRQGCRVTTSKERKEAPA